MACFVPFVELVSFFIRDVELEGEIVLREEVVLLVMMAPELFLCCCGVVGVEVEGGFPPEAGVEFDI